MRRRLLGWILVLSIALILVALYLAQKEHSDTENDKAIGGVVTTLTGTSSGQQDANYTPAFILGTIGIAAAAISGTMLRRD